MYSRCSVCKRPLSDPDSMRRGVGPVCAGKSVRQPSFLMDDGVPPKALFEYTISGNILIIKDVGHDSARTVTNDAENVLRFIQKREPGHDLTKCRIIYRDSDGQWDGMRWDGQQVSFYHVGGCNEHEAAKRAKGA